MAEKTNNELDAFAFELFKATCANGAVNRSGEQMALASYRKAEAFLSARDKVRSGALEKKETGPQLADYSAPNLAKTHPHNLVSKRFGNLETVAKIKKWLDDHPTPETDQEDFIYNLQRTFPLLNTWDIPAVNTARTIFPAYVN